MAAISSNALTGITTRMADGAMSAGSIIQVVHANSNSHLSSTSTSYVDLTGVTASITPSATSSKILITCTISIGKEDNHTFLARLVRDGSAISGAGGVKESGHSNQLDGVWWNIRTSNWAANPCTIQYLDSPSTTSSITYKAQGMTSSSSYAFALNRTNSGDDGNYSSPGFSQITLMEVAA